MDFTCVCVFSGPARINFTIINACTRLKVQTVVRLIAKCFDSLSAAWVASQPAQVIYMNLFIGLVPSFPSFPKLCSLYPTRMSFLFRISHLWSRRAFTGICQVHCQGSQFNLMPAGRYAIGQNDSLNLMSVPGRTKGFQVHVPRRTFVCYESGVSAALSRCTWRTW